MKTKRFEDIKMKEIFWLEDKLAYKIKKVVNKNKKARYVNRYSARGQTIDKDTVVELFERKIPLIKFYKLISKSGIIKKENGQNYTIKELQTSKDTQLRPAWKFMWRLEELLRNIK